MGLVLAATTLADFPDAVGLGLLVLTSVLAGVINTIAGGGSMLIVPVLLGLGLSPGVANGTLRVAVLVQTVAAGVTFHRKGFRDYGPMWRLVVPICAGAAGGTWLATRLPDEALRAVFGVFFALWAIVLVVRPGRFVNPPDVPRSIGAFDWVLAAATGLYGGFLQVGVGFPLLALLVLRLGYAPVAANATKMLLALAYTMVSLPMFALAGQVAWREGLALALGAVLGGWLGTRWQIKAGAALVRWFVVVMVAASGAFMLMDGLG